MTDHTMPIGSSKDQSRHVTGLGLGFDQCAVGYARGSRNNKTKNEDNYWPHQQDVRLLQRIDYFIAGRLYIVADGVSGGLSGDLASELAAKTIAEKYYASILQIGAPLTPHDIETALKKAIMAADQALLAKSNELRRQKNINDEKSFLQTTVICALLRGRTLTIANVGDSHIYSYHNNNVELLYKPERAGFVGINLLASQISVSRAAYEPEDVLILCSDGLYNYLAPGNDPQRTPAVMTEIFGSYYQSQGINRVSRLLLEKADHAKTGGGGDNITVMLVKATPAQENSPRSRFEQLIQSAWLESPLPNTSLTKQPAAIRELAQQCNAKAEGLGKKSSEGKEWLRRVNQLGTSVKQGAAELEEAQKLYQKLGFDFESNHQLVKQIVELHTKARKNQELGRLTLDAVVDLANTALLPPQKEQKVKAAYQVLCTLGDLFNQVGQVEAEEAQRARDILKELEEKLEELKGAKGSEIREERNPYATRAIGKGTKTSSKKDISESPSKSERDVRDSKKSSATVPIGKEARTSSREPQPHITQEPLSDTVPKDYESEVKDLHRTPASSSVRNEIQLSQDFEWDNPLPSAAERAGNEEPTEERTLGAQPFKQRFARPLVAILGIILIMICVLVGSIGRDWLGFGGLQADVSSETQTPATSSSAMVAEPTPSEELISPATPTEPPAPTQPPAPTEPPTPTQPPASTQPVLAILSSEPTINEAEGARKQIKVSTSLSVDTSSPEYDANAIIEVESRLPSALSPLGGEPIDWQITTDATSSETIVTQQKRLTEVNPENMLFELLNVVESPHSRESNYLIVVTARLRNAQGEELSKVAQEVEVGPLTYQPALSIDASPDKTLVTVNDIISFTVIMTNTGETWLDRLVLNPEESQLDALNADGKQWQAQLDAVGQLEPGQAEQITLTAPVKIEQPQVLTTTLAIDGMLGDNSPVLASNSLIPLQIYARAIIIPPPASCTNCSANTILTEKPDITNQNNPSIVTLPYDLEVKVIDAVKAVNTFSGVEITWYQIESTTADRQPVRGWLWSERVELNNPALKEWLEEKANTTSALTP